MMPLSGTDYAIAVEGASEGELLCLLLSGMSYWHGRITGRERLSVCPSVCLSVRSPIIYGVIDRYNDASVWHGLRQCVGGRHGR